MCGICGIYGKKPGRDEAIIKKMIAVLHHRGPDSNSFYIDENISLGHARLSIIDLSERGKQPMANEDKTVWVSVNGEIYNFKELRDELEKKGHRFYSKSDSEVVVHSYEEYGLDFVKKFNGMFAFALYDKKKNRLVLARDPIGEKPLYYYYDGKELVFASEIKAVLEAGIKKEVDKITLYNYLSYQYSLGERTFFKNIKKVLAGNMVVLEGGNLTVKKYWDIKENLVQESDDYFIKKLRELLEESIRLKMVADVPIGYFLSGGIDSSAVVALARQYSDKQFHTFSVGFETFSELKYAKIVSRHLKTTHHELIITADMVAKDLPKIAWHYDEPLGDAAIINNYYLSKEAAKYVKVLLAGEGGDELFAGYPNYKRNLKYFNFLRSPRLQRSIAGAFLKLIPGKGDLYSNGGKINRIIGFFCQPNLERAHLYTTRDMTKEEISYLTNLDYSDAENSAIPSPEMKSILNKMLAVDCKNLLPEKFLMKADKSTMANSVEERLPILDKNIIEFAFSVPENLKIRNGQEKYILREAVRELLPPEIIDRPKQGFGTPVDNWLLNPALQKMVCQTLLNNSLIREVFKEERIRDIVKNLEKGNIHRARTVWIIFALGLWHQTYFN